MLKKGDFTKFFESNFSSKNSGDVTITIQVGCNYQNETRIQVTEIGRKEKKIVFNGNGHKDFDSARASLQGKALKRVILSSLGYGVVLNSDGQTVSEWVGTILNGIKAGP